MTLARSRFFFPEPPPAPEAPEAPARPWTLDGLGNQELLAWRALPATPAGDRFVRPLDQNPWWHAGALAALGV